MHARFNSRHDKSSLKFKLTVVYFFNNIVLLLPRSRRRRRRREASQLVGFVRGGRWSHCLLLTPIVLWRRTENWMQSGSRLRLRTGRCFVSWVVDAGGHSEHDCFSPHKSRGNWQEHPIHSRSRKIHPLSWRVLCYKRD